MKQLLLCNILFIKRAFRRLSFLILLILIPILSILYKNNVTKHSSPNITAGIFLENETDYANNIIDRIATQYGSVRFEKCRDIETLKKRVMTGVYECGYYFPSDFDEMLIASDMQDLITVYTSPATMTVSLANEYVYSEIFREYVFNRLIEYIRTDAVFKDSDLSGIEELLRPAYDEYINSDATFSFEFMNSKSEVTDNSKLYTSFSLASVNGLLSMFVMFAGFMGVLNLYKDNKRGIFFAFSGNTRTLAKMSEIFIMTLISSVVVLITIYICGISDGLLVEILRLLIYMLICCIYLYMIYLVTPNQFIFATMIPLLTLGSAVFCPVFADLSEVIPFIKYFSWVFLPKYYFLF